MKEAGQKKVEKFDQDVTDPVTTRFSFGKIVEDEDKTLGWNAEHDQGSTHVSQVDYIKSRLERLNMEQDGPHEAKTKLTDENKSKPRQLIGKLI